MYIVSRRLQKDSGKLVHFLISKWGRGGGDNGHGLDHIFI